MSTDAICELSATGMRAEIRAGHLSAREVVSAHLARIERLNPAVNAIVTLDADGALAAAARADEAQAGGAPLGLLHGLPVAHKDCFLTAGMRTTWGSPLHADHVPDSDSLIVARQRAAGAITLGKTNMPEFGAGSQTFNPLFGATRNPYDLTRTAGGSSGGAAAALACRMVALADGSDMGGSLRNPASFCNVVGLRPSPGRVPQVPSGMPYNTLTVAGPMGRTVADVALMLAALVGEDLRDPLSLPGRPDDFLGTLEREMAGLRVAVAPTWGGLPTQPPVVGAVEAAAGVLADMGCRVAHACLDFGAAGQTFGALRALSYAVSQGVGFETRRRLMKDTLAWNVEAGLTQPGLDIVQAERERTALFARMHAFMQDYDFIVGPVSQVVPFPVDEPYVREIEGVPMRDYIDWMRSGYYLTLTGHPAISVPFGFDDAGLPIGVQIVGRYRDERGLLAFAHMFESATNAWRRSPAAS